MELQNKQIVVQLNTPIDDENLTHIREEITRILDIFEVSGEIEIR